MCLIGETNIGGQPTGFRSGRGCIDQIFTFCQVLEQRHIYERPTISIFLDLKGAFDSVDQTTLFNVLERKGVPLKYVNILRALYAHTTGKVRVYRQISQSFDTPSGVRQSCPISPFLFNFVMDEFMRTALAEHETVGVDLVIG